MVISVWQLPSFLFPKLTALPRLCKGDASPSILPHPAKTQGRVPRDAQEREGRAAQASGRRHPSLLTNDDAQVLEAG